MVSLSVQEPKPQLFSGLREKQHVTRLCQTLQRRSTFLFKATVKTFLNGYWLKLAVMTLYGLYMEACLGQVKKKGGL